ncbi:MAG TPA: hypothetical protein PK325_13825 [Cyclobacteriaceae bacterium]|nr:hypothetical protein [Cyclobacteriaceae bacterium]HMV10872.1 hypothetical protein [Cyclobacteriaceae bacterium]HMV88899.1 hypothetical protein [Cyclobacteriaceae bacterium]HMW99687.1 hypothetical protein [Cyclobacteriaceae bacterium]HMX51995.1 hypothetical protein [Cyclobacteriaceae bacterium]
MPELYDITEWNEQPWLNTGGTRNKKIYQSPADLKLYYFKQSFKRLSKDYKYEFWSEIIAYELGKMCGFNVLPYHIAVRGGEVGCISKSMINSDKEELVEGGRYIQAFDNAFNPDDRSLRHRYSFELIAASLKFLGFEKYISDIIEMLVFDALIGNSDRHQENWALINTHSGISKSFAGIEFLLTHEKRLKEMPGWLVKFLKKMYTKNGSLRKEYRRAKLSLPKKTRFSPIYDNGCSFGRELLDDKVVQMINDDKLVDAYVKKGLSEIHWKDKKVSHFVLLTNLLKEEKFREMVQNPVKRVIERFKAQKFSELISKVDVDLPLECQYIRIPSERKELMSKLVLSRIARLKALIEEEN